MLTVCYTSFFFSSRRRHTRWPRDWSSDVCSSDLLSPGVRQRVLSRMPCGLTSLDVNQKMFSAASTPEGLGSRDKLPIWDTNCQASQHQTGSLSPFASWTKLIIPVSCQVMKYLRPLLRHPGWPRI